jgi:hypothetical protein
MPITALKYVFTTDAVTCTADCQLQTTLNFLHQSYIFFLHQENDQDEWSQFFAEENSGGGGKINIYFSWRSKQI